MVAQTRMLDFGLNALVTEADRVFLCSSAPTTYAEIAAAQVGVKVGTRGAMFAAITANPSGGRKTSLIAITDGDTTASGNAAYAVVADSTTSQLLMIEEFSAPIAVLNNCKFALGAFNVVLGGSTYSTLTASTITSASPVLGAPAIDGEWPDASSTGVPSGVQLTPYNSDLTTTSDNQVIDALEINGDVIVIHDNVTIKRCLINGTILASSQDYPSSTMTNLLVQDCEIDGQDLNAYPNSCILICGADPGSPYSVPDPSPADGAVIERCNIWDRENGVWIEANDVTVRDCYFHELRNTSTGDPHIDGVQIPQTDYDSSSRVRRTVIEHCNFDCPDGTEPGQDGQGTSSCITWKGVDVVLIDNCRLVNGAHLVDNCGPSNDITIQDCLFLPQPNNGGYWDTVTDEAGAETAVQINNTTIYR